MKSIGRLLVLLALGGATDSALLAQSANLSVAMSGLPNPVAAGATLTYTLTVSNEGPDDALTVVLDDPLPIGTTFTALVPPPGWSCIAPPVGTGGTVSCSLSTLPPGTAVFGLAVTVDGALADGSVLSNTATVSTTTTDSSQNDHQATQDITVSSPLAAAIGISKTAMPDPVLAGSDLTYTLAAENNSAIDLKSATVTDLLPAGTTFVSLAAAAGWNCTTPPSGGSGTISCDRAPFAPGTAVFTLVVHVSPALLGGSSLANTAQLDVLSDGRPASSVATARVDVIAPAAAVAVPTLGVWGLGLVAGLLVLVAWRRLEAAAR